ncbi:hypothetical protein BH20ACT11_BH20ACT11_05450 [soil metagenome]
MDPFSDNGAGRRASGAGRSNRGKLLLVAGSLLALIVLVIVFVSSGASDEGRDQAGTDASSDRASQDDNQGGGPGAGEGSTSAAQEDKQTEDEPSSDTGSRGSGSDTAEDGGSSGSGSAGERPMPERAQDPDVAPQPGEKVQSSHDDGEQAYVRAPEDGERDSTPVNANQPGSYDPLGRGAESDGLTGTEEERARFAASNFVTYAYGYTGDDIAEYHEGLFDTMLEGEFQKSPGRADIQAVEDDIRDGGTKKAAVLDEFDIQELGQDEIKGVAYFTVGESYDGGGVSGNTTSYAQPLNLQKSTTGWTVVAADKLREVPNG